MKCKSCGLEMEYEEIKFPCGFWYCECGKEYEGEKFPCDADESGITDFVEKIGEEIKEVI